MWGLVCSDEFDDNDAKVVCRSLGYQYGRKQPRTYQRHIPMLMTKVNCTGTEESLDQCDFPGFGAVDPSTCSLYSYYSPASVVCYNNTEPEDVEYRIANGGLVNGRLELSIDQRWGTMCRHSANNAHASIACKRLGFADGIMQNYKYGPGDLSSPIWLRCYSDCDKEELTQCEKKYGIGMTHCNRNHLDDLGIFCNSSANDAVCGKVIKKIGQHFGEFRTPGYPISNYPVSCKVLWMIVVPHGFRVSLYISEIKLQASDKCTWKDATDILEVLDASLVKSWQAVRNMKVLGRFCGDSNPTPMKTMGNRMLVKFRSDKTTTAVGFSAYYQSECDGAAAWMRDGTVSSIEGTDIMKRPSENVKHCQRLCDSQQFCQELYFDQDTKTCYTKLKAFVGKNVIVNGASLQFFKKQCINCNGHYSSVIGKGMAGETLLVLTATKEECISHCRRRPSCESVTHTTENTCKLYTFSSMSNPDNVVGTPSTNLYNLLCKVESGSAKSCAHLNNRVRKSGWYRINAGSKQISVFCHMKKYGGGWTLLLATKAKSCNTPTPILSEFERTQKLDKEYSILEYNKILREQSDTDYTKYLVEVVSENRNWKSSWIVPVDYDSNSDNNIELSKHINADEATLTRTKEALQALNNGSVIQDNSNFYFGENCNNPVTDSGDKMTIFLWVKNIKGQRVQCGYNICKYGGVCSYKNGQRECKCPAGFSGDRCQIVASRRRKIGTQFHKYQNKLFNTNHVSKTLSDASEMECMQECLSKSSCMAFNYKKPDNGQVNCHVIETNVAGRRKDHDNHWHMYKRLPEGVLDTEEDEL